MRVAVIAGPIASGKSALGRAVASLLEEQGAPAAVIDLDLVYELLDPASGPGRPKDDDQVWTQSRRLAGRLAAMLLEDGRYVVAEGDFGTDAALAEFEAGLPPNTEVCLVMLALDLATAFARASADSSRGLSRERSFLSEHYRAFRPEWSERDVLQVDTRRTSLRDAAHLVVRMLIPAR